MHVYPLQSVVWPSQTALTIGQYTIHTLLYIIFFCKSSLCTFTHHLPLPQRATHQGYQTTLDGCIMGMWRHLGRHIGTSIDERVIIQIDDVSVHVILNDSISWWRAEDQQQLTVMSEFYWPCDLVNPLPSHACSCPLTSPRTAGVWCPHDHVVSAFYYHCPCAAFYPGAVCAADLCSRPLPCP